MMKGMEVNRKLGVIGYIILLLLITSCTRMRNILIIPAPDMHESRPVSVKLYWLKSKSDFEKAENESLWEKPKVTLGQDLVGDLPISRIAIPAKLDTLKSEMPKGASYLGILVYYSELKPNRWKKAVTVITKNIIFKLGKDGIEVK